MSGPLALPEPVAPDIVSGAPVLSPPDAARPADREAGGDDISSRWRVAGASVQGVGHARLGLPCQDAHGWRVLTGDVLAAVVADGAGSAPLAEVGAELAARSALDFLSAVGAEDLAARLNDADETGAQTLLRNALTAARQALDDEAVRRGVPLRDLATTLLVLLAAPQIVLAAQIGDGAIILADATGKIRALTAPPAAEYVNETTFLTAANALDKAQITVWRGAARHVALFSDGLQMLALKMPAASPHPPFFAPLFRFADAIADETQASEELAAFLRSPRITERADDDLTLLLAGWAQE